MKLVLLTVCMGFFGGCQAARILAIFPSPSRSHWIMEEAYLKGLHARGHEITVFSAFGSPVEGANWTHMPVANSIHVFGGTANLFSGPPKNPLLIPFFITSMNTELCRSYLQNDNLVKLYKSDAKYDLLIISTFFDDCLLAFSHRFKVPVVAFSTFNRHPWFDEILGNPDIYLEYVKHTSFFQRLKTTIIATLMKVLRELFILPKQWALLQEYVNDPTMPSLKDLQNNVSLLFLNDHVSIGYARPLVPNIIHIAGIHLKPPKKLPQDLQKFLDSAKNGVVYFSLGSNLKSAEMPEEKRSAFLKAFSRLEQQVLWKWEEDTLPGQPSNVKLGKWFPQTDILAHKNVKLFVTHGGLLSTQEAIYHGVPLVAIPVFGDQEKNSLRAEEAGYGRRVTLVNVTEESIYWAISEVLNNPSYSEAARGLSLLFHDRPRSPLEEAVYWTEYVMRHGGAKHMRSAAVDLAWYQYMLLDVAAFVLAGVVLVLLLLVAAGRFVIRKLAGKKNTAKRSAKKRQ